MSLKQLWEEYSQKRDKDIRNEIIRNYVENAFVNKLLGRMVISVPNGLDRDDLIQFGNHALIEAVERYDPNQGARFETYASWRIQGAIIDQIRSFGKSSGNLSRNAMSKAKTIEAAIKKLEQKYKRIPKAEEVANHLEITKEEYYKMLSDISINMKVSLDDMIGEDNMPVLQVVKDESSIKPEDELIAEERYDLLAKTIDELPDKQRKIIQLYYHEELNLKEIGYILNLTEGRISQLHTEAILRLKMKMQNS